VRELPRQLSREQLEELFEGRTALVDALAGRDDPLGAAREALGALPREQQVAALNSHPAIGAQAGLSARSAAEQGSENDPAVLAELARLNADYEARHGFRFVVFVNRRPRREILEVLRHRIGRSTDEELATGLDALVAIAQDRWQRRQRR
jgi:2-oxo-4-hydroxy-4-carboxy--5-ureidoimidazoline (OHCU) decarboxylase